MATEDKDVYNILFDSLPEDEQNRLIDMYAGNLIIAIARVIWKHRKKDKDGDLNVRRS